MHVTIKREVGGGGGGVRGGGSRWRNDYWCTYFNNRHRNFDQTDAEVKRINQIHLQLI